MKIRKAALRDVPAIVEMNIDLYRYHDQFKRPYYDYRPTEDLKQYLTRRRERYIRGRKTFIFVAEDGKQLIGFLTGSIKDRGGVFREEQVGDLGHVYVIPKYRGRGIGKKLVNAAEHWLRDHKVSVLEARVDSKNKLSETLMDSLGYEPYQRIFARRLK